MKSLFAASELDTQIKEGMSPFSSNADDLMGATDCPNGCSVEPDGQCPHGWLSAGRSLGVI